VYRGEQLRQLLHPGAEVVDLVLHVQDPADALQIDALILREPLDQAEPRNVACRVASTPLGRTPRRDQAHPVVGPQRLGVHASEVGCDGDDKDWRVMINSLRQL
jgi:hypothetical protein